MRHHNQFRQVIKDTHLMKETLERQLRNNKTMLGVRIVPADAMGLKFLLILLVMYCSFSFLVYSIIHMKFVKPLEFDAPLNRFSESRAVEHVRVLAQDGRQEGRMGLRNAASYIKGKLDALKTKAGPYTRIEVEENTIHGSFNMVFLGHSISLAYRNHTNIIMRLSSLKAKEDDPSVLINGHFDSTLGSPGAGDCGSCVASMLEIARVLVETNWVPPQPIIFLFNGAEELFMLGSHGFMTSNKWRDSVGASINVEASGTGGPDLVCQSGPGPWPSLLYSQSAKYPMAHSAAQDIFQVIPGDTDYRIFSEDYGNIPSLDIIFLLGGYYYHTTIDTVDKIIPGSIQVRGDNLLGLLKAFSNSSRLHNASGRQRLQPTVGDLNNGSAIFFDYLSLFMIYIPRRAATLVHILPVATLLVLLFFKIWNSGLSSAFGTCCNFMTGLIFHAASITLAIVLPVIFSILKLLISSYGMSWFSRPYLAFIQFIPCSLLGLLLPRMLREKFLPSQNYVKAKASREVLSDEAKFFGAVGFYSVVTLVYLISGFNGGFLTLFMSFSMLFIWFIFGGQSIKSGSHRYIRSVLTYLSPLVPLILYSVYFGGLLVQFVIEKMGMMGSLPPPLGNYIADIVVAAMVGIVVGWCVGPLLPFCGDLLARPSILQLFLHASVVVMALSSQCFPYSSNAPKRVVFQHSFITKTMNHHEQIKLVDSTYDFSVVDSNSLLFIWKYAPEVAKNLHIDSEFSFNTANISYKKDWLAIYPVSYLFSNSMKFPAMTIDTQKQHNSYPYLFNSKPSLIYPDSSRRVYLDLNLGDLEEVWVTVLNITGPLSNWSFAGNVLPAPETADGGPPSYICRISGAGVDNWSFWLEASSSHALRVDVAVLDQVLGEGAMKLKGLFPKWIDVVAYSSFMSSYLF